MWIYRKQDMLEKEQEDIRVWVDPQRISIHSIKWSSGEVQLYHDSQLLQQVSVWIN